MCIKLHRSEGRQRSEFCLESAACEGEGGVADGAAPVALDGVGGSPSASQNEGEGVSEGVELIEVDGVVDEVVAEGHGGELEAVEVRGAVSRLHEEVEEVAFGGTLKAAWCVAVKLAGADLGVGEEGVAHPGEVDADVGRLGEGEEDGGRWTRKSSSERSMRMGTGRGCQTVAGDARAATPRRTWVWKLARSWMGCGRGVRWSASVQGVPKRVGASWSVRSGVLDGQRGRLTRAESVGSGQQAWLRRWRTRWEVDEG